LDRDPGGKDQSVKRPPPAFVVSQVVPGGVPVLLAEVLIGSREKVAAAVQ
jgi:hypothetical protein